MSHFNFRSLLLDAVVNRAGQPSSEVHNVCCNALKYLFQHDVEGEASFEAVRAIAKLLVTFKYDVPEELIRCLLHVKLKVHADDAKVVHKKAKQERKKRKR